MLHIDLHMLHCKVVVPTQFWFNVGPASKTLAQQKTALFLRLAFAGCTRHYSSLNISFILVYILSSFHMENKNEGNIAFYFIKFMFLMLFVCSFMHFLEIEQFFLAKSCKIIAYLHVYSEDVIANAFFI